MKTYSAAELTPEVRHEVRLASNLLPEVTLSRVTDASFHRIQLHRNTRNYHRIIRAVLGVLLIGNVFVALQHPVGWIGVILLATAIFGICPLYSLLNINTKSAAEKIGLK